MFDFCIGELFLSLIWQRKKAPSANNDTGITQLLLFDFASANFLNEEFLVKIDQKFVLKKQENAN